jgi:hypothetical protein
MKGQWEQPDPGRSDERQRVQVGLAAPQAPVQAGPDRTAGVVGAEAGDHVSGPHLLARRHERHNRLVRGAQAVGVVDAHDSPPTELTGEPDGARAGGVHRRSRVGGQVDAAVAGQPWLRRR